MEIAKETDLPDLLESLGYQVRRVGSYHTTKEMDSLRIKNRRTWFRYSEGVGGDAITFLQRFCGKSFPEAVEYLLDYHGWARDSPAPQKSVPSKGQDRQKDEPPPPFALPLPNTDQRRVFAYLQKRGIAPQVIRDLSRQDCCTRTPNTTTACLWGGTGLELRCSPASAAPMTGAAPASKAT